MKKQFWLVLVFGLWCLASAWWYLYGVKGVSTDPLVFKPEASTISIIEILIMLLVAFIIGYGIAWSLRGEKILNQIEIKKMLKKDNSILHQANADFKIQIENGRLRFQKELANTQQKINSAFSERDNLKNHIKELEQSSIALKKSSGETQEKNNTLESEIGTLRYRLRQLEFQNKEHEEAYSKLKGELEDLVIQKSEKKISDHPFVRLIELNDKDDLTKIKGIGPFIEKRLNMIGIYTFKQLSELTPELVDRVGAAIEFFPHRIERDDWVGQARSFLK